MSLPATADIALIDALTAGGSPTTLYQPSLWIPSFPNTGHGDWTLRRLGAGLMQGYWGQSYLVTDAAVLLRDRTAWMSVTPVEIESQELGCHLAYGHVAILGFGMGIAAANAALNPAVTAVTVIELDPDIHALAADLNLPAQLPPEAAAKLRMVQGDATRWTPESDHPVDVILADYWLPFFDAGRLTEMEAVQANIGAQAVFVWGQELSLAWALHQAHGRVPELGDDALAGFIATATSLPLLWPRGVDYGRMLVAAARYRMPLDLRHRMFPVPVNAG